MNKKINTFEELVVLAPQDIIDRLEELKNVVERPDFHPEPNCYEHIRIVTSRLIKTDDIDLVLAGLYHDIGKRETMKINPNSGFPMTPGHEAIGAKLVMRDSEFIVKMGGDIDIVHDIVKNHMKMKQFSKMRKFKQQVVMDLPAWPKLQIFTKADSMLKTFDFADGEVTQTEKTIERDEKGYAVDTNNINWIV
jgi:hypothetical protein